MDCFELNQENESDDDSKELLIKEFFTQIENRIVKFFEQYNGIEIVISNIINNEIGINESLEFLSNNFSKILLNYSKNLNFEDLNNKELKKITKKRKNDFNLNNNYDDETKKYINKMLEKKIKEKIFNKYGNNAKNCNNVIIPDGSLDYQYYFKKSSTNFCYYICSDRRCEGRGKINKNDLTFSIFKQHSLPFEKHTYIKKCNNMHKLKIY